VSFLLDTTIISDIRKPKANSALGKWVSAARPFDLYLSVLAIGEIRQGIERIRRRDGFQAEVYEEWLSRLRRDYADRILPITSEITEEWGKLNASNPVSSFDGLMAATAKVHNLTFVTRNVKDIVRTGVRYLNPFQDIAGVSQ
jgi:toxin FitB